MRSLETGRLGLNCDPAERELDALSDDELVRAAAVPTPERIFQVEAALRRFVSVERVHEVTGHRSVVPRPDPADRRGARPARRRSASPRMTRADWRRAKRLGFSDAPARVPLGRRPRPTVRAAPARRRRARHLQDRRHVRGRVRRVHAVPLRHLRGRGRDRAARRKPAVVILGSGPNRIGQGVEFDYCCVHAAFALRDAGLRDRDGQLQPRDRLDRLRHERPAVLRAAHRRRRARTSANGCRTRASVPRASSSSLGGQTPLKLAHVLERSGIPVLGTSPGVDRRGRGPRAVQRAVRAARHPAARRAAIATDADDAVAVANAIGYPVLVRPSYVLGGRAMQIVYDDTDLRRAMAELAHTGSLGREGGLSAERPALIDRFLEDAIEVDVDALRDRTGDVRDRRGHGAHRGGRRALRRLRVRDPAAHALGRRRAHDRAAHARARRRARASSGCSTCSTR